MPTINQLPLLTTASAGDQVPVYSPNNGDARRLPLSALVDFIEQSAVTTVNSLTISQGNLSFSNTSQRITGDLSNAVESNRVLVQSSVANGNTNLGIVPNGSATAGAVRVHGGSDVANSVVGQLSAIGTTEVRLNSTKSGTASYAPLTFYTNAAERMRIDTSGNVGIGTTGPTDKLTVVGSVSAGSVVARITNSFGDINSAATISLDPNGNGFNARDAQIRGINVNGVTSTALGFYVSNGATPAEAMRVAHTGNVIVGSTTSITGKLTVWDGLSVGANDANAETQLYRASTDVGGGNAWFNKARGTIAAPTIVSSGDIIATIRWRGYDGAAYQQAAQLLVQVDGTPGAGDMPGRMIFLTTPDGSATPAERMRITNAGDVGIGTTSPGGKTEIRSDSSGNVVTALVLSNPALNAAGTGADLRFYVNDGTSARYAAVRSVQASSGNVADLRFLTANTDVPAERVRVKHTGQVRFVPLASDPAGAESGDVYYDSGTNKLRVYNGTSWVDLH